MLVTTGKVAAAWVASRLAIAQAASRLRRAQKAVLQYIFDSIEIE
jgi:hypothetical protein